ncbi:MAG: transposase [Bacteroidota bacterium]
MENKIQAIWHWKEVEILEMNIQPGHVHLVCSIPPKFSVSDFMGIFKKKVSDNDVQELLEFAQEIIMG